MLLRAGLPDTTVRDSATRRNHARTYRRNSANIGARIIETFPTFTLRLRCRNLHSHDVSLRRPHECSHSSGTRRGLRMKPASGYPPDSVRSEVRVTGRSVVSLVETSWREGGHYLGMVRIGISCAARCRRGWCRVFAEAASRARARASG